MFYQSECWGWLLTRLSTGDALTSLSTGDGFNQSEYGGRFTSLNTEMCFVLVQST